MRVFTRVHIVAAGLALTIATASIVMAETPDLPATVPAPEVHTAPAGNIMPRHIGDTPIPEAKPGEEPLGEKLPAAKAGESDPVADDAKARTDEPVETPPTAPIPDDSPIEDNVEEPQDNTPAGSGPEQPAGEGAKGNLPDSRSGETRGLLMPPSEVACRQRLRDLGAAFADHAAESDPAGCAVPYPLSVTSLGKTVALEPAAEMNCAMAEAAARFTAETIAPAARRELGAELTGVGQASAYVCRPRNGTRKLSEHAFGNALDIASFTLSDGKSIAVELRPEAAAAQFLGVVRRAACGPFKTVLGPGSNADHATHLHLDLAPRKHGGAVCE